MEVKNF